MLAPSLFNDSFDLFDRFYQDPWFGFNDHEFKNLEKKLYGHRAKNIMNTDIKESDSEYEMVIDLPGFNWSLQVQAISLICFLMKYKTLMDGQNSYVELQT